MLLKTWMKDAGYSVRRLARELGVSERQVFIWRSGAGLPRRSSMAKIELLSGGAVQISDHYAACASPDAALRLPSRRRAAS